MNRRITFRSIKLGLPEKGATMAEYALIIVLIGIIAIPTLSLMGVGISNNLDCTKQQLDGQGTCVHGGDVPPPPPPPGPPS